MVLGLIYPYWRMNPPSLELKTSMDVVAAGHAREMSSDADVHVYIREGHQLPRSVAVDDVRYHHTSQLADWSIARLDAQLGRLFHRQSPEPIELRNANYAVQAAKSLKRQGARIIQIYIFDAYLPIVRRYNPDARIVLSVHDHRQITRDPDTVAHNLRHADLIVACSDFMARELTEHLPQFANHCISIPNAVDLKRFETTPYEPSRNDTALRVLYVGRISPEKGVHHLVDAFRLVLDEFPESRLQLIGPASVPHQRITDPSEADPLFAGFEQYWAMGEAFSKSLKERIPPDVRDRIEFLGELDHEAVSKIMRESDVLAFPSIWKEPFGLPVIEAMASGLPVIATRAGAFEETVVDGETGLLVERGDVEGLAKAMTRLAGDLALRRDMGKQGRARAEVEYNWDRNTRAWREAYGLT